MTTRESKEPWEMTRKEYDSDSEIPEQTLPENIISEILQMSDWAKPRENYVQYFDKYAKELVGKGYKYIDAYHVTDADIKSIKDKGIIGSELDYIGQAGGNVRPSSVYLFLEPHEISRGYPGISGASGHRQNIVHLKIPIKEMKNMYWDANFNISYETRSSVAFRGDIPNSWIQGIKKYHSPPPIDYEVKENHVCSD